MSLGLRRAAVLLASFAGPALGYALVWQLTAPDTLRQLGYQLWVRNSTDDLVTAQRILVISSFYEVVMPALVGLVGLVWGWAWWRRHAHRVASGDSQTSAE